MNDRDMTRRRFIRDSIAAGAACGALAATGLAAESARRILGSNERIHIAQIGCGGRNGSHTQSVFEHKDRANATIIAVCDIWKKKREAYVPYVEKRFGAAPKTYADYRQVLDDKEIDAVIIATPDHQHCGQLADSVRAGKDVYVEKPIAVYLEDLNRAYDAVKETGAVVQHGTQGRSSQGTAALRELVRSGKMGKLFRVESTETAYQPYWNFYECPKSEEETNWKEFLYGRPDRPFDPDQHGCWMGYHEFSTGTIGGWMSHFIDYVHAVTGCGFPRAAVTHGGIFAPTTDRRRTSPDTVNVMLEYAEGFVTHFTTHFGSAVDNETTTYFFEKGTVRSMFGHNPGAPVVSGEGSEHKERIPDKKALDLPPTTDHMLNFLECIRSRKKPNADMDAGYMHGVACLLGYVSWLTGRKTIFDPEKREVRPA